MKTLKHLKEKLTFKEVGYTYVYEINNTRFEINEFNYNKGWCLNEYVQFTYEGQKNYELVDSYGYEGLLLRDCKNMIVRQWNNGEIK